VRSCLYVSELYVPGASLNRRIGSVPNRSVTLTVITLVALVAEDNCLIARATQLSLRVCRVRFAWKLSKLWIFTDIGKNSSLETSSESAGSNSGHPSRGQRVLRAGEGFDPDRGGPHAVEVGGFWIGSADFDVIG
jgi:hypothetical protein